MAHQGDKVRQSRIQIGRAYYACICAHGVRMVAPEGPSSTSPASEVWRSCKRQDITVSMFHYGEEGCAGWIGISTTPTPKAWYTHPAQSPQKVVSSKDARGHSLEWPSLIGSARRWGESAQSRKARVLRHVIQTRPTFPRSRAPDIAPLGRRSSSDILPSLTAGRWYFP